MKKGSRNFERNCQDLEQISDKDADIYGSELCRDILCLGPYSLDLLKMQLEQERFFQRIGDFDLQGLSDQENLSRIFHESVRTYLEERLARYDAKDRQGVLLELFIAVDSSACWAGEEIAAIARMPMEQLMLLVIGAVERYAIRLCAERAKLDDGENRAHLHMSDKVAPIAAALSIAAYAEYPQLRFSPELIAFTSSAAANTARAETRGMEGNGIFVGAYMELMIAMASLVEWPTVSEPAAPKDKSIEDENSAKILFKAFLALFFTDLAFLLGAKAVGVVVEAAAILSNLAEIEPRKEIGAHTIQNEHAIPTEENQEDQTVDEDEQEDEDESNDEWEFD